MANGCATSTVGLVPKYLLPLISFGLLAFLVLLPPSVFELETDIGSRNYKSTACVVAMLLVLFIHRFQIIQEIESPKWRACVFFSLITVLVVYTYCFVVDWDAAAEYFRPVSRWIGIPTRLFFVPFVSFLWLDLYTRVSLKAYFFRSIVELAVVFPVWIWLWQLLQMKMHWINI